MCAACLYLIVSPALADSERGAYIMALAGCADCHTDIKNKGKPLAGGRALKTPFGVFYAPNITTDAQTGIGKWTKAQFIGALRHGRRPDGSPYYPVFPYPSYTRMTLQDMGDLWDHMQTLPSSERANTPHDLKFLFRWRFVVWFWRWLYFDPGEQEPVDANGQLWNRGRYIANALSHCEECHTPRNFLGGLDHDKKMAGALDGPVGLVPNITPDKKTGIGDWSESDLDSFFSMGMLPDGDFAGAEMAEVTDNTSKLIPADMQALILYLRSLPSVKNDLSKKNKDKASG